MSRDSSKHASERKMALRRRECTRERKRKRERERERERDGLGHSICSLRFNDTQLQFVRGPKVLYKDKRVAKMVKNERLEVQLTG